MREEELHGPSDLTDFKVGMNGQVQVQVLGLLSIRWKCSFALSKILSYII